MCVYGAVWLAFDQHARRVGDKTAATVDNNRTQVPAQQRTERGAGMYRLDPTLTIMQIELRMAQHKKSCAYVVVLYRHTLSLMPICHRYV